MDFQSIVVQSFLFTLYPMDLIQTAGAMQALAEKERRHGRRLALVPTMGALHRGHLALVEEARQHADHVAVSIFVNPTQFGLGEDFERYPRALEKDLEKLETVGGVDVVFAPSVEEMYPGGPGVGRASVEVERLAEHLCGRYRPGHFRGVTTVVTKLFHLGRPHVAVFGLKDAQQFLILRRMVEDLHFGIRLVGVPIMREADGLALSSRNVYLSPTERAQAVALSEAATAAREGIRGGEQGVEALVETMLQRLAQADAARVEYAEIVDQATLQPLKRIEPGQDVLAAVAVYFGPTRLIDNAFVTAPPGPL